MEEGRVGPRIVNDAVRDSGVLSQHCAPDRRGDWNHKGPGPPDMEPISFADDGIRDNQTEMHQSRNAELRGNRVEGEIDEVVEVNEAYAALEELPCEQPPCPSDT